MNNFKKTIRSCLVLLAVFLALSSLVTTAAYADGYQPQYYDGP